MSGLITFITSFIVSALIITALIFFYIISVDFETPASFIAMVLFFTGVSAFMAHLHHSFSKRKLRLSIAGGLYLLLQTLILFYINYSDMVQPVIFSIICPFCYTFFYFIFSPKDTSKTNKVFTLYLVIFVLLSITLELLCIFTPILSSQRLIQTSVLGYTLSLGFIIYSLLPPLSPLKATPSPER